MGHTLLERNIEFMKLGKAGTDKCPILDAVEIKKLPNTSMSGAVTLNCNTALNLAPLLAFLLLLSILALYDLPNVTKPSAHLGLSVSYLSTSQH